MEILLGQETFWSAVRELRAAAAELDRHRTSIAREVDALLDAGWRGEAATAFAEAWSEWLDGAAQVDRALTSITESVALSGRELTRSDHSAAETAQRLRDRLAS